MKSIDDNILETEQTQPETLFDGMVGDLEGLGRVWANHGLRVGAAAIQTSALSLTSVAGLLVNVAETLKTYPRTPRTPRAPRK